MANAQLKKLIEDIAKVLVDAPDKVEVKEVAGEKITIYELRVAKEDLGKVIGRDGKMARAIRTIVTAASMKHGKRAHLEILE